MKEAIVVLGMHRSGTSSLAGALGRLGAGVPKTLMPDHPDNPKGYWESWALVNLSDRILKSAGSSWSDWRPFNPEWQGSADGIALSKKLSPAIKKEFDGAPLIVCKDPRMCRIFPIWRAGLKTAGYQCRILTPLRSPVEVAASLHKRDGFTIAHGMMVWLRHVLDAEVATRDLPRRFVHWTDVLSDWRTYLVGATTALGVTLPRLSDASAAEVDAFLDTALRRQAQDAVTGAPAWVADAWTALQRLVADPLEPEALAELDRVRTEFDAAAQIFGPVLIGLELEAAEASNLRDDLKDAEVRMDRQHHELIGMTANRDEHAAQSEQRNVLLIEATGRLGVMNTDLAALTEAKEAADAILAQTLDALSGMTANRDEHARLASARHVALETLALQTNDLLERLGRVEAVKTRTDAAMADVQAELAAATDALVGMTENRDEHQSIAAERWIALNAAAETLSGLTAELDAAGRTIDRLEQELALEAGQREALEAVVVKTTEREAYLLERTAEDVRLLMEMDGRLAEMRQTLEQTQAEFDRFRRRQDGRPLRTSLAFLGQGLRGSRAST